MNKKRNKCCGALIPVMKSKDLSRNGKGKIYKTIIRPAVLYAYEKYRIIQEFEQITAIRKSMTLRIIFRQKNEIGE